MFRLLLAVNSRYALSFIDVLNHFGEERSYGEDVESREGLGRGNRVRDDDFFELRLLQAIDGRSREDGMGRSDVDILVGTTAEERLFGSEERTCGIDHVVVEDAGAIFHVSDHFDDLGLMMSGPNFVHDREFRAHGVRELLRLFGAADIRRDDDGISELLRAEIVGEKRSRVEHVHRHREESLNLIRVQVERDHVVGAGFLQEFGDELGRDCLPRLRDAILACVREVGEDDVHGGGETELRRLAHEEEFEERAIGVAPRGLQQIDVFSAYGLLESQVALAGIEALEKQLSKTNTQFLREVLGKCRVRGSREDVHWWYHGW